MQDWDFCWIALLARVARGNVGFVDWNPYLPWLFTKVSAARVLLGAPALYEGLARALAGPWL